MKIILSSLFLLLTALACIKEPIGKNSFATLYYSQTSCADPWPTGTTDSLTLVNVASYLNSLNLYIASLNIKNDGAAQICTACICKTGKTIYVSTLNSDMLKAKYEQIGFKLY